VLWQKPHSLNAAVERLRLEQVPKWEEPSGLIGTGLPLGDRSQPMSCPQKMQAETSVPVGLTTGA
jgi:hypothetical protein